MTLKCIQEKCKYYVDFMDNVINDKKLNSITKFIPYYKCKLTNEYISNKCEGVNKLEERKEEVGCKIQKLTQEYEYLNFLQEWVRDNQ